MSVSMGSPAYVGTPGRQATLPAILYARAAMTPDDRFVTCGKQTLTYAQAVTRAERAAGALFSLGVRKGDRVVVMLPNTLEFLDLWFATALLGAVLVPVNTQLRGDGLRYVVDHSGAGVAVVDASVVDVYDAALVAGIGPTRLFARGGEPSSRWSSLAELLHGGHARSPTGAVAPKDLAAILYTSGTTGLPKGVMTCHNAYVATGFEYAQRYVGLRPDDVLYTCLPLFHINAQALTTVPSLLAGRPMVMDSKFAASRFLDDMRKHRATVLNYIGAMLTILLKQPERPDDVNNPVRLAVGSSAPAERWAEFQRRFGIHIVEIYGLTETAGVCLASPPDDVRIGKCGIPVSWADVRIQREDGNDADIEEPGEFVVRSKRQNTMFLGYYKNPTATAEAMRGGWFHSGDRGRRAADGYFTFIDRLKDSIRRRGENISSYEIERIVVTHPAVAECAAVGVASELGEDEVLIVVVPRGEAPHPAELTNFCRDRMAAFMVPRYVRVVAELPKTPTQKVQKYALRQAGLADAWDRASDS
jgi:carnitine-CoA ligase